MRETCPEAGPSEAVRGSALPRPPRATEGLVTCCLSPGSPLTRPPRAAGLSDLVQSFGFEDWGLELRARVGAGCTVQGLGRRLWSSGLRVLGQEVQILAVK